MSRLKLLIFGLFLLAGAAGVVVGMNVSLSHPAKPRDHQSWLVDELGLNATQADSMRKIWSDMLHGPGQKNFDRRHVYQKERDEAVLALLTDEQRTKYAAIQDHYNQEMADLAKQREAEFKDAVEKTKAILTEPQRAKYDELMKRGFRGAPGDHGDPGRGPGPHRGSETMPDGGKPPWGLGPR